jgi:uncharacterized protein YdhG (YjbR/CyaY superfamily)
MADQKFGSVEEYIGSFPAGVQPVLEQVRRAILDAVPGAGETISYHIPTITFGATSASTRHRPATRPSSAASGRTGRRRAR